MQILTRPDPKLKVVAEPVVATPEVLARALEMFTAMRKGRGIGLAAPQVGWSARLFVMHADVAGPTLFLNPRVVKGTVATAEDWEGCLSVPGLVALVLRPEGVRVEADVATEAQLAAGTAPVRQTLDLRKLAARCAQHEIDHLDGKLIVDRAIMTRATSGH